MYNVRKRLTHDNIWTIPNIMSVFRLVMIPFIVWTYYEEEYSMTAALVVVSAVTDILDGMIARRFNMVSDLGKALDPTCDKLTHAALLLCLMHRYKFLWMLFVLLAVKELCQFAMGLMLLRKRDAVKSARWYGKMCTAVLEVSMLVLILFPELPLWFVEAVSCVCAAVMTFSFVMYMIFFISLIIRKPLDENNEKSN